MDNRLAHYMVRDGQVILPNAQPEYREAIIYLKGRYEDALMNFGFISQDGQMFLSKIRNNQAGRMGRSISGLRYLKQVQETGGVCWVFADFNGGSSALLAAAELPATR